jgi:hypothetical protein
MLKYEFRLAGDDSLIGTKELETLPNIGDQVEVGGEMYTVEEPPRDPSSDDLTILVRKTASA